MEGIMGKLKFLAALWAAKLSRPVLKITGHNGTNFPGELAIRICPDFLKYIGKPAHIISVTGTNGKTTVNNMVCDIFAAAGKKVLDNRAGSNINSGIATSLIIGANLFGKAKYDTAVFETDERSALRIYPWVRPEYILITNLFRDSIMRNGHPEFIAGILTDYIPKESKLIINADDLISCSVAPGNDRVYYGIEKLDTDLTACINLINDMRICPRCAGKLEYDYLRYHHIGRAHCSQCDFTSPAYDYSGHDIDLEKGTVKISDRGGT
jgi:UDP-N-acetylmuramyl tripeptide synthase